jgi:hypothetical protein
MAFALFIDESGRDNRFSPYEVLAGISVEDSRIWNLITALHDAEIQFFGQRITKDKMELKAKKLIKRKTFRLASQLDPMDKNERTKLALQCLEEGRMARLERRPARVNKLMLTALAQAKIEFAGRVLEICSQHQVRAFASIVDRDAPRPEGFFLRKDYAYLFERFFYFLDEQQSFHQGLVIFDELERTKSHILVDQMSEYFQKTAKGRHRSSRIVPEPFFVHSDLTSLIQVADLVAYIISWGVKVGTMSRTRRDELGELATSVCELRHRSTRRVNEGDEFLIWSFALIDDLRPKDERDE